MKKKKPTTSCCTINSFLFLFACSLAFSFIFTPTSNLFCFLYPGFFFLSKIKLPILFNWEWKKNESKRLEKKLTTFRRIHRMQEIEEGISLNIEILRFFWLLVMLATLFLATLYFYKLELQHTKHFFWQPGKCAVLTYFTFLYSHEYLYYYFKNENF